MQDRAGAQAGDHGPGLGRVDAQADITLGVDHRVFLSGLVQFGGLEVFLDDGCIHLRVESLDGEIGLLGPVVLVEEEGGVVDAEPGVAVADIPESDAVDDVLVLAEHLEEAHVLVLLEGALPVGDPGLALVEAQAAAHVLVDADVQFGDVDVLDHLGVKSDGCVDVAHGRAVDVVVPLHADAVHRHAGILHPLDKVVDAPALGRFRIVVVIVEEKRVGIGFVGVFEGLVDEFLTGDPVHRGVPQLGAARSDGAVGHGFIDHVPAVDDVLVAVHHGLDVVFHVGVEFLFGEEFPVLVLVHPGADLAVPHQGVAAELDVVPAAEVGDPVGILPVEFALARLGGLRLHGVLGGDAVEFAFDQRDLAGIGHVAVVDGDADHEIVFIGVFQAVGRFRDGPRTPLGQGGNGPDHQGA